jgi:hypothetical protein
MRECARSAFALRFPIASRNNRRVAENAHCDGLKCDLVGRWILVFDSQKVIRLAHQLTVLYINDGVVENKVQCTVIVLGLRINPFTLQRANCPRCRRVRLLGR